MTKKIKGREKEKKVNENKIEKNKYNQDEHLQKLLHAFLHYFTCTPHLPSPKLRRLDTRGGALRHTKAEVITLDILDLYIKPRQAMIKSGVSIFKCIFLGLEKKTTTFFLSLFTLFTLLFFLVDRQG